VRSSGHFKIAVRPRSDPSGLRSLHFATLSAEDSELSYLTAMFTDVLVLSALAAAVIACASWMLAIERTGVAYAYPFMALSFVVVPLAAALLFGESVSRGPSVGLAMIGVGVAINAMVR
jgi:drug/metabolite transporter (DMT)-like permease